MKRRKFWYFVPFPISEPKQNLDPRMLRMLERKSKEDVSFKDQKQLQNYHSISKGALPESYLISEPLFDILVTSI